MSGLFSGGVWCDSVGELDELHGEGIQTVGTAVGWGLNVMNLGFEARPNMRMV